MRCDSKHIAPYRILQDGGGKRVRFFCEASGAAVCAAPILPMQPIEAALEEVCPRCASFVSAKLRICSQCGERLPQNSLLQIYQRSRRLCPVCDTVLSNSMKFCPHCGMKIAIQKFSGGREGK